MVVSDSAGKHDAAGKSAGQRRNSASFLSRKIWLPKTIYAALPYFYLVTGIGALLGTLYISTWLWILPHYLLFSAACMHMGVLIFRRRHPGKRD